MSTFPGSPKLFKSFLAGFDPFNPFASAVVFQYNPETLTRRIEPRAAGGGEQSDRSEAFRLTGPPKETITFSAEVDLADQLEQGNPQAIASGLQPALSALEMMVYPKSISVIENLAQAQAGIIEIVPPEAPLTLFGWSATRVLPVRVTSLSITEEAFDPLMHPIRAKIDLTLQVLTYHDLRPSQVGHAMFLAHQVVKELMASSNVVNNAMNIGAGFGL